MPKTPKPALTKLELRLMQVIWRQGPSTVASVGEQLSPELAYTTVQTMLNILERKGHLTRKLQGRAYLYTARMSEASALTQAVRDLVDRMFGGSSEDLVMSLLKSKDIDSKTIAALTRKLEREGGSK